MLGGEQTGLNATRPKKNSVFPKGEGRVNSEMETISTLICFGLLVPTAPFAVAKVWSGVRLKNRREPACQAGLSSHGVQTRMPLSFSCLSADGSRQKKAGGRTRSQRSHAACTGDAGGHTTDQSGSKNRNYGSDYADY